MLTGTQCAAARALLRWKQGDLSEAISANGGRLSVTAITAFERGGKIRDSNAFLIQDALFQAGVQFIPENGGGAGVRLRDRSDAE
ncbi:MAG: transcriptional regulator [Paracoccaceae bacterium]